MEVFVSCVEISIRPAPWARHQRKLWIISAGHTPRF
jgi:hypothetical protein